jgi:predicted nucleic acid-binding Zn ribbon protein
MTRKKKCKHTGCGKPFTPATWFQRFCSEACRLKGWRKQQRKKKQEAK